MAISRLSTKGQLVLPKEIRTARAWGPGTEFTIEETKEVSCCVRADVLPPLRSIKSPAVSSTLGNLSRWPRWTPLSAAR